MEKYVNLVFIKDELVRLNGFENVEGFQMCLVTNGMVQGEAEVVTVKVDGWGELDVDLVGDVVADLFRRTGFPTVVHAHGEFAARVSAKLAGIEKSVRLYSPYPMEVGSGIGEMIEESCFADYVVLVGIEVETSDEKVVELEEGNFNGLNRVIEGKKVSIHPPMDMSHLREKVEKCNVFFATDMDHTLLGDDEALVELKNLLDSRDDILWGIATGRSFDFAKVGIAEAGLPDPDFYIVDVGSQIFYRKDDTEADSLFESLIGQNWDRELIQSTLERFSFLKLQPDECQFPFKLCYFYPEEEEEMADYNLSLVKAEIKKIGIDFTLLFSAGIYIDILPSITCKGAAVRYLSYHLDVPLSNFYTFGDSGNDSTMFTGLLNGVIVSNHKKELDSFETVNCTHSPFNNAWAIVDMIKSKQ